MRARVALLSIVITLLVLGASAATASAQTICVDTVTPQLTGCDIAFPYDASGLDLAVDRANGVTGFEGEDTVRIAPGTLTIDIPVSATTQIGFGPLHIVGAGRDQTKLLLAVDPFGNLLGLSFDATAQPTSSISDLSVEVPGQIAGITGVNAKGGKITRTRFTVAGDPDSLHRGLVTSGSSATTVTDSDFELIGGDDPELSAIVAGSDLTVSGVTMRGTSSFLNGQQGIQTTGASSNVLIDASRFENLDPALSVEKGTIKLLDSLILNPVSDADTAIRFASTGATDAALITSGVTAVGARVGVNISTSTASPNVDINNSIIQTAGPGAQDIACAGSSGQEPDVTMRNSIRIVGTPSFWCHFAQDQVVDRSASPPVFGGADDFRPAAGSPQIDAGEVIWPTMMGDPSPLADLAGAARLVDGNGDGSARLDVGAYEYQLTSQPPPNNGGSTTPPAGLSIKFGKAVGKFKLKPKAKAFKLTSKRTKPRLPITSTARVKVILTLKKGKKKLKGSQSLTIPAGISYVTFSGKFAGKKLKPGKYTLYLTAPSLQDSPKSILNVIR